MEISVVRHNIFCNSTACGQNDCIQDTLSSRAALGLPAARPSASREQRYLAYNQNDAAAATFGGVENYFCGT